jgi:hypothetical protein
MKQTSRRQKPPAMITMHCFYGCLLFALMAPVLLLSCNENYAWLFLIEEIVGDY